MWWKTINLVMAGLIIIRAQTEQLDSRPTNQPVSPIPENFQPQQIHISLGEKATDMVVMWSTKVMDKSIVEYHTGDRQKRIRVEGETVELVKDNEDGARYIHRVYLENLQPEQKYYYHVRGESLDFQSAQYSFTVPAAMAGKPHTFMVFGDLGTQTESLKYLVQEAKVSELYEAIFHIGDISYDLNRKQGQVGDSFLKRIETAASRVPYMTAPGDHERYDNFLHYRYRFSMPSLPWPMQSEQLWYSIDIGPIHFIIYSTEVFFYDSFRTQPMLEWLKEDLNKANARRSAQPWIIVMGHRPMYCSVEDASQDCTQPKSKVRAYLEEIFYTGGVDLVISGHQHYYERTWPVYKQKALQYNYREPKGPVHITIGTLGLVYMVDYKSKVGSQWSAFVLAEKGRESFGRLKVYNATHLYWEVLEASNNALVDKMWIIQPFHRPFSLQQIFIPNPLGDMGERWLEDEEESSFGLESFLGLNGMHYGDDYQTKFTVLMFVFIFLVIGMIARKKVLNLVRICCFKKEACKKVSSGVNGSSSV